MELTELIWFFGFFTSLQASALAQDIPNPMPKIANGAWSDTLTQHPRLLGPRAHLKTLAKEKPQLYNEIRTNTSLLASGIAHAVDGIQRDRIEQFINSAMKKVEQGVTNIHQDTWVNLTQVILTYDPFFDEIPEGDRKDMIEWMNTHLGKYTTDENAFHNSTLSKILCYLRIAYGTWGENPKAKDFRDYALEKLYEGKIVPVLLEFGAGGGFTECGWYSRHSLWHLVQALELVRRLEGYDGFQKAPRFFYQRLAYEMLQPYPGLWMYGAERYPVEGDGAATYGGHNEYPRHLRTVLSQYFRGSELSRYVANKRRQGSNFDARLTDFLYEEEPDPPIKSPLTPLYERGEFSLLFYKRGELLLPLWEREQPPYSPFVKGEGGFSDLSTFPLAHLASGIGRVYARSDWTDDATWFRFECGDMWNHHQHFEVGNFEIFRYEPLATESGEYHDYLSNHSVNWLLRTIAHNCILIFQPGEQWTQMRDGGRNEYANDGGQTKKWQWVVDTLDIWKSRREQFELGNIVAYENRPEYMYVAGDCTKAYSPSKLALWIRQIVFIRPHTFVIFDRVVSTQSEYEKTWLLHCRNEPEINGKKVVIINGKGRLTMETLLPEEPVIRKVEGYQYRGQSFDPPRTVHSPMANRWRVEVLPSEPQTEDLFLHVLTTDDPMPASLIREQDRVGVAIDGIEALFDGKVGCELKIAGKSLTLKPVVLTGKYE